MKDMGCRLIPIRDGEMSSGNGTESLPAVSLGEALEATIRKAVNEALQNMQPRRETILLTAEELAVQLKVPVSWVYEQSRQGNLPTHRFGKYIRFDLQQVLRSYKKD